jgi:putative membrane-bound dehydrogenase-like protein
MRIFAATALAGCVTLNAIGDWPRHPVYGFPLYTNQPAGRQMAGQWAPAATQPLSPDEERKSFRLPKGFEARLFASEPDIANPVAMTWDEKGRLWVLELYEYPLGAKPGSKGRDRVKILEDTDGDGKVDKVTVFAEGFSLATGLAVGRGGVFVGEAPHLWFLEDTDGDGVADRKTAVLDGFGLEDRHELLNGFNWGPDGRLYFTHGVFTHSKVVDPDHPGAPVEITAGVARLDTPTRRLEVFAEGTSNPWGVDFDGRGNAFVSACVIDHFFHLAPGGLYERQAGQAPYPYAYEYLPSVVDHLHHMAAYAGVCIYEGDQWPAEWRGEALMGNIHQNALNHDHLTVKGSSFNASKRDDFLTTSDGWFMPVSTQVGQDGSVWIMDWYDKYPCYQNANADPNGVDLERGRIWRIVWVGDEPGKPVPTHPSGMDLGKLSPTELVGVLRDPNVWRRRMAQRVLSWRPDRALATAQLVTLAFAAGPVEPRLAAFWTLGSAGLLDENLLDRAAADPEPALRQWAARFTGDRSLVPPPAGERLIRLASDPEVTVRSAAASACRQHVSGALTVNTPPPVDEDPKIVYRAVAALIQASKAGDDRTLDFLVWTAAEPLIASRPDHALGWLRDHGAESLPLSAEIARKTIRRLCDFQDAAHLELVIGFLSGEPAPSNEILRAALGGLMEGQRGRNFRPTTPTTPTGALLAKLQASADVGVVSKARELGALWGDASSARALLNIAADSKAAESDRIRAIQTARLAKVEGAADAFLAIARSGPEGVQIEAIRAAADSGGEDPGPRLLALWNNVGAAPRRALLDTLASRPTTALELLDAVTKGAIKTGDLPPTVIRSLATHRDGMVKSAAAAAFGRFHASGEDKLRLIAQKRRAVSTGPIDLAAGREIAKRTCLICHKFFGEGANVGPDLTGVGRSSLDALLHNVINPNEIVGKGYENVEIETKDGRTLSGRMVENDGSRVRILMAGPAEEVVSKAEIKDLRVGENSVMPEGLEQMPDADFRNLIWYILAPPQEGRELTPDRKRELMGGAETGAVAPPLRPDGESVALWSPGWEVASADRGGEPLKLPEHAGRRNVLATFPFDSRRAASIARAIVPPTAGASFATFAVAASATGEWELRVLADGELIHSEVVRPNAETWRPVRVDLTRFAGRRIVLRLENALTSTPDATAYWADLRLDMAEVAAK